MPRPHPSELRSRAIELVRERATPLAALAPIKGRSGPLGRRRREFAHRFRRECNQSRSAFSNP